jgi:hypothetical protein
LRLVGLPQDRTSDDGHGHVEVLDHPSDHRQLLEVLLAEVGAAGTGDAEQLRHDGRDAIEMRGS